MPRSRSPHAQRLIEDTDNNSQPPLLCSDPQSFAAIGDDDSNIPRIVVLGATGSGKSTLLNIFAGYRASMAADSDAGGLAWQYKGRAVERPLFESNDCAGSVTMETAMVVTRWLGKGDRVVLVDTPGVLDSREGEADDEEKARIQRHRNGDLHAKLKHLKKINAVLVLHSDFHGNKLDSSNAKLLKDLASMFESAGGAFWKHVIVGYSKMNTQADWSVLLDRKRKQMQSALGRLQSTGGGVPVDVTVLPLGGVERDSSTIGRALADEGIDQLWEGLHRMPPLSTTELQLAVGDAEKYASTQRAHEDNIKENQSLQARLRAAEGRARKLESDDAFKQAKNRFILSAIVPFCLIFTLLCMFGRCYWWLIALFIVPFFLCRNWKDAQVIKRHLVSEFVATHGRALVMHAQERFGGQLAMVRLARLAWPWLRPMIYWFVPEMFPDGEGLLSGLAPEHEHAD
jgi:hypothetical protein